MKKLNHLFPKIKDVPFLSKIEDLGKRSCPFLSLEEKKKGG
jgi:hypothetical protein